jgi:hypothetical protein
VPDTTAKGFPYPEGTDAVDVAGDIQALAEAVDDMPGVQSYTATEITNLTAGEKWAGRIVWNSTAATLQVSNGSTFSDVDSTSLSDVNPAALGVAAPGASANASRSDHVHTMPTAANVGAAPTSRSISAGNGLTGGGDLSANRTLSANFASANPAANGTAAPGTATSVSRGDHVHPTDTSRAALNSPTFTGTPAAPTAAADTNTTQVATTAYVVGQAGAATPQANGVAAVGTSLRYSRQDHVHTMPTAANVGAIATTALTATNPAALSTSAAPGSSTNVARLDHVHPFPTAANVGAIATTALTTTNPAALGSAAAPGNSTNVARLNHVHPFPTASDVGAVANSLITNGGKGALVSTNGSTVSALAVGANDTVLTADSSTTTGLAWKAPASGGLDPFLLMGA